MLYKLLPIILTGFIVTACAGDKQSSSAQEDYMQAAYKKFDAHFDGCTQKHGYDPERSQDLGDYVLGENERAWRQCVYEGAELYIIPSSKIGERYEALIRADKTLTEGIEKGAVTRAERHAKITQMLNEVRSDELDIMISEAPREKAAEQQEKREFNRRMVDSLRGLRSSRGF